MTAQSIVCGACSAEVPYGRLSCPSCGDLLASVTRGRRRSSSPSGRAASTAPVSLARPSRRHRRRAPRSSSRQRRRSASTPGCRGRTSPRPKPSPADPASADVDVPVPAATAKGGDVAPTTDSLWDIAESETDDDPTPEPLAAAVPAPRSTPRSRRRSPALVAYVPPPPVRASVPSLAPARAWAVARRCPVSCPVPTSRPGLGLSSTLPPWPDGPARLAEFTGWLSVAGAALAAVGFLLPWGVVMIGSTGAGYFDRWAWPVRPTSSWRAGCWPSSPWRSSGTTSLHGSGSGCRASGSVPCCSAWSGRISSARSGRRRAPSSSSSGRSRSSVSGILALAGGRHAGTDRPV